MSAVVLWRHAPTEDNEKERLQGLRDTPLADAGRARAAWAAQRLADSFGRDVDVYASPLSRAVSTAQALADLCDTQVRIHDAFIQRSYGVWEGLTWDEIRAAEPAQVERHRQGLDPEVEGWERHDAVARRVRAAVEQLWDPRRTAVVVSHGGPIGLGLHALLDLPLHPPVIASLPHAAWAVVRRSRGGSWQLDSFGRGAD